jgi:hypothetical protein
MSLSSLIVQREIATIRQVEEALARQVLYGGDLVTNLLEVAKLDEGTLTNLLAESFGLSPATLGPLPAPTEQARALVGPEMATTRAMVPLSIDNGALVIAIAEPLPKEAEEELAFALGLVVEQRVAPMVRVREALARAYGAPLERRLQRLLTRLGSAPIAPQAASAASAPAEKEGISIPPAAKLPYQSTPTPIQGSVAQPAPRAAPPPVPAPAPASAAPPARPSNSPTVTVVETPVRAPVARRRRGPLLLEEATKGLEDAASRDDITQLFFDYSRQYFDYSALFVVQNDIAEGREAFGDGAGRDKVLAIGVPLDLPSVLARARDAAAAVRVKPAEDGLDAMLMGDMERKTRGEVLVVPIILRKRTVAILYGDSGDDGIDAEGAKAVISFALLVGQAFEKLIVRKKAQAALGTKGASLVPAAVPQAHREPHEVDKLLDQTPTPALPRVVENVPMSERPPPPNAFVLRRPSGAPIPREEPADGPGAEIPKPTSSRPAPSSESFAAAPRRPPSAHSGEHPALPSVIVDVNEELVALVDKVIAAGADEAAESELLRQGQHAMPAIMSRFPGLTVVDRARAEDGSLRAAECGPVLRLIAGQRRTALPFLLPLVGDGDPQRRFWATFLLTELPYPEVVESLVPRLFDPDPSVRKVARLAARIVGEVAPEALIERLVRYYRDPSLTEERRIEMIDTLGELRERLAIPILIDALGEAEEHVAAAARRSLVTITRQDGGRDVKRWQAWWAQNAGRHRIEWLIDALMHDVPAVRRAAGDELKALTKEYFGYYDDLPRKEREQAQQRYRDWWRTDGRLKFQKR